MEIIPLPTPQDFESISPLFLACSVDVEKSDVILVLDSLNISEWGIVSIVGRPFNLETYVLSHCLVIFPLGFSLSGTSALQIQALLIGVIIFYLLPFYISLEFYTSL